MDKKVKSSPVTPKYTSTGRHSGFQINLYHMGLDEHKNLSAIDRTALSGKIHTQKAKWEVKWEKELDKQRKQSKEQNAADQTHVAQEKLKNIETILEHTLDVDDAVNWEDLKHKDAFSWDWDENAYVDYIEFDSIGYPESVCFQDEKSLPKKDSFFEKISFSQKLLGKKKKIIDQQEQNYDKAVAVRNAENEVIRKENIKREAELEAKRNQWKKEKEEFEVAQEKHNEEVDVLQEHYKQKEALAIQEYCELVLANSDYPDNFPKEFDLQYNESNGMLLVDYFLPAVDDIPSVNNVRYVKSRDEIDTKYLSKAAHAKLYDAAIYQIVLRTLHELFEADVMDVVNSVNLNGYVRAISASTGHEETNCILSIQVQKESFLQINLDGIASQQSYKECFKSLKGVGSTKLSTMTAVKPLLEMDRSDKRFRDHYEVADGLNEEMNIAAMDWEDFEHLVREIFQKEFSGNGGEVRVTQASSDGGVDAIAFDPDPIRGGKIVIQAKRYTNVVGVAAVRDLYGTVLNEGATKGILVTTSDYGSDSYDFAKDKPITLISGSNLLHLLEKHGHSAKIDIKEAKKMLKDKVA